MTQFVLYRDIVCEVEIPTTKMYKLRQYRSTTSYQVWAEIDECIPITKEVADCMVACDPPTITFNSTDRYAEGWSDPRSIFK